MLQQDRICGHPSSRASTGRNQAGYEFALQGDKFSPPFSPVLDLDFKPKIEAITFTVFLVHIVPSSTMPSTTIAKISRLDLPDLSTLPLASITDVKHLSSYNWIEAPTPTIAVPGSPPIWSAPRAPRQLNKDSGLIYIAQNAARHPDSPFEPLFRALYIANPSFDIRSVDVVTDRNNIRKLLSFINPGSTRNGCETFTINVEVTKNTAMFSREETETNTISDQMNLGAMVTSSRRYTPLARSAAALDITELSHTASVI